MQLLSPESPDPRSAQSQPGIPTEKLELLLEPRPMAEVICVEPRYVLAARRIQACIARGGKAAVLVVANKPNPGIAKFPEELEAVVR
jgi:hypothetical protein